MVDGPPTGNPGLGGKEVIMAMTTMMMTMMMTMMTIMTMIMTMMMMMMMMMMIVTQETRSPIVSCLETRKVITAIDN